MTGLYSDEANKIKNGRFHYYHPNGIIRSTGTYHDNKKTGLWLQYHNNGMLADSTFYKEDKQQGLSKNWSPDGYITDSTFFRADGSGVQVAWFTNGSPSIAGLYGPGQQKTGKWKYYHRNGKPSSEEYYKNDKLIDKRFFNEDGTAKADTTNPEKNASFPGGQEAWRKYLLKNLYFPSQYKLQNADQATVVVSFIIDESGKVAEAYVSDPFHPAFDAIALRLIQKSPDWIPAIDQHNRHVKAYRKQPVSFVQ
ncbi:energy transducer TonB [Niabella beijingensis]|uniref:energy transducer TonB n=1 Tax=Niabella beijingensis TaxID=2872700 RepID=UPI001CBE58B3|nr:energy transducer TonB [Niabella beijingensis]MBZ4191964.1 energy transducer TonB [Niabella beijingensis]